MGNDNYLLKVKKNIDKISKERIESYINSSNDWYDQLIETFSNSINSVNYADWNDDVKDKVDDNYLSIINMIKYCKSYNEDVLKPFSVELEVLKEKLKRYYESNNSIEELDKEINTIINNGQEALEMLYSNLDNWALNYDTFIEQLNSFYRPREEYASDLELLNEKTQQIHVEIFDDNLNKGMSQRAKSDMLKRSLEQYYEPRYLYDASHEAIRVEKTAQLEAEKNATNSLEKECYDAINKLKSILDGVKKINVQSITSYTSSKTQFKGLGEQAINVTYEKVDVNDKDVEKLKYTITGTNASSRPISNALDYKINNKYVNVQAKDNLDANIKEVKDSIKNITNTVGSKIANSIVNIPVKPDGNINADIKNVKDQVKTVANTIGTKMANSIVNVPVKQNNNIDTTVKEIKNENKNVTNSVGSKVANSAVNVPVKPPVNSNATVKDVKNEVKTATNAGQYKVNNTIANTPVKQPINSNATVKTDVKTSTSNGIKPGTVSSGNKVSSGTSIKPINNGVNISKIV